MKQILDRTGRLIAQVMTETNGNVTLLNRVGYKLGYYSKSSNTVFDRSGRRIGSGIELLYNLIPHQG